MREDVIEFISNFIERYPDELTDTFLNGFCYYFAIILKERFGGSIFYCPDIVHFSTLIDGRLYDITGLVKDDDLVWYEWDEYKFTEEANVVQECCIKKI